MPSARALLVASLLTEPPYGCLGPSGNDRYRKRTQTMGACESTARSRHPFRNESAARRHVRAGAIGEISAMTRTAFCRKSPRLPRVCWLGGWALGASDRENTATTERWRDKRPQCAARSVGCCCFPFLLIWQCAALVRNVRLTVNALQAFDVSHIAEAGHD